MRTTVTFTDDVAAAIEQRRREQGIGVSEVVNGLVRRGLVAEQRPREADAAWPTHDLGRMLVDVTNVAEAISLADGFDHR